MSEPENPTESTASASDSAETAPPAPRKAPRKSAPRKSAAAAESPVAASADSSDAVAPTVKKARKSAKKAAQPELVEAASADAGPDVAAETAGAPDAAPVKAPRRRAAKKAPATVAEATPADSAEAAPLESPAVAEAGDAPAAAARPARRRSSRAAGASTSTEASADEAADAPASAVAAPSFVAPTVLFVPPSEAIAPAPRTRRRSSSASTSPAAEHPIPPTDVDGELSEEEIIEALDAAGGLDTVDVMDAEEAREVAAEEATGARRRRRRGRRGRGGRNGGDTGAENSAEGADGAAEGDATDTDAASDGDSSAEVTDSAGSDEQSDGGGGSTSSRRRRRRRRSADGAADSAEGSDSDDPPNTVVHVRNTRGGGGGGASDDDGVRGVRGSTRLEAKRQRRRDGRDTSRRRPPILTESEFLARRESVDRVMAVRELGDRTQIAVLEDNILVEHYVTRASSTAYAGNVYLGRVQNVLPSMEAAFIDIGKARNGVLYAGEVNWDAAGIDGKSRAIENALSSGDTVLVQVTKDPVGQKGARLTSQISLPGRFLVYVPNGAMTGISRKLPDVERTRLKSILKKIVPEDAGVIVRTAAEGASEADLTHDVERLKAQWEAIQAKAASPKSAPTLLYGEPDLAIRVVRDVFNEDFNRLVVQGDRAWSEISGYVNDVAPDLAERASKYVGTGDLFGDLRVDEQLTKALDRKVYLPSGGSLVIDRTEAMTVVDVNTGKFVGAGGNLEQTVTRNNLEAAEEIVRQLRLRDVGGIVVIDFIDMVLESNRDLVLRRLTECLGRDRTKHQVAEVTSLGLVQMTRKRVGEGLLEAFSEPCEHCKGRGVIVHSEPVGIASAAVETVEEGGSKRRGRRNRGKGAAVAEPIELPEPMTEEQRRAAATAMAAMAGVLHHDHDGHDHDGHDHDDHGVDTAESVDSFDDSLEIAPVSEATDGVADESNLADEILNGSDDADLIGASAEVDAAAAEDVDPAGDSQANGRDLNGQDLNGHGLHGGSESGFSVAVDWVSDSTAELGATVTMEHVGASASELTESEPAGVVVEPIIEPVTVPAGRRPRRRAASRPAGPPTTSS
ncbi:ribonuclease E [Frankineae bacterium MT45]|nr:ribonuclease E [Frankineae bacterium MT45]